MSVSITLSMYTYICISMYICKYIGLLVILAQQICVLSIKYQGYSCLKEYKILFSVMLHTSIDVKKYTCYLIILNLPDDQYCNQSTLFLD